MVARRRGEHNRLGFALQLGVRFLGTHLADPLDVPTLVIDFLAEQLQVLDASVVTAYTERLATRWEHTAEIRAVFGYRVFSESIDRTMSEQTTATRRRDPWAARSDRAGL